MNDKQSKSSRIEWIDNAKGISILLVIIGHIGLWIEGKWNFRFVFGIHLVMFFLLAGFTSKKKDLSASFFADKFSKLMPPYFYTCLAVMVTDIVNSYLFAAKDTGVITGIVKTDLLRSFFASGGITNFGNIELNTRIGAIWFLPAMFFSIVLFQVLLHAVGENEAVMGGLSAAVTVLGMISARFIWLPFSIQSGMMAVFFLWLGYEIKRKELLKGLKGPHYLLALIILIVGIKFNYCGVDFCGAYMNDAIISLIVGLAGCSIIYLVSKNYKGRLLNWIGQNSLTVLCVHLYALETMYQYFDYILNKTPFAGDTRVYVLMVLETLFAVGGALVISVLKKWVSHYDYSVKHLIREAEGKNDSLIGIFKGILVISILIKYFAIDEGLRTIISTYDFAALLFAEGISRLDDKSVAERLKNSILKYVIPYLFFVSAFVGYNYRSLGNVSLSEIWSGFFLCDPNAEIIFMRIVPLWPAYYLLILFAVSVIYELIDLCIRNDVLKLGIIVLCSIGGTFFRETAELYIPFNVDVVLYGLLYYAIGTKLRKRLSEQNHNRGFLYFVLSPIFVYAVYLGGLNVEAKRFEPFGLVAIGTIAGIIIILMLSGYLANHFLILKLVLTDIGKAFGVAMIVYALMNSTIIEFLSGRFDTNHFVCMGLCVVIQLGIAVGIEKGIGLFNKMIQKLTM